MTKPRKPFPRASAPAPEAGLPSEDHRGLSPEDRAHIEALHAKFGEALSLEQVEANYRMSLGLPDGNGRTPNAREQLGAMKLFADLLVPRPKAPDEPRERTVIQIACPFCSPSSTPDAE